MSRICKTGKRRQYLVDTLKKMRVDGQAWLTIEGERVLIVPVETRGLPSSNEAYTGLVRVGDRVFVSGLSRGGRRDDGPLIDELCRIIHPKSVLAEVVQRYHHEAKGIT